MEYEPLFDFQTNESFKTAIEVMILNGDAFSHSEFVNVMRGHYGVCFTNALFNEDGDAPCEDVFSCHEDCIVRSFCVHRR